MTRDEAIAAFPVHSFVQIKGPVVLGRVISHETYDIAMIGHRTFIRVISTDGRSMGEFDPKDLERVADNLAPRHPADPR